jgi:hypothetical protein
MRSFRLLVPPQTINLDPVQIAVAPTRFEGLFRDGRVDHESLEGE